MRRYQNTFVMTTPQPALPQPHLEPAAITVDQYLYFTPERLELVNGCLGYGGQEPIGFQLAVLTNMGLLTAIRYTGLSILIESLDCCLQEKLETVNAQSEVAEAMLNRLNRAMEDLVALAEYLES